MRHIGCRRISEVALVSLLVLLMIWNVEFARSRPRFLGGVWLSIER
jgi:hypothetical protein